MKKNVTIIAVIALLIITIVLSLANRQVVTVNYLFGHFRLPLILVIFGSILIGFLLQYLLGLSKSLSLKHQVRGLQKQLADIKQATAQTDSQEEPA